MPANPESHTVKTWAPLLSSTTHSASDLTPTNGFESPQGLGIRFWGLGLARCKLIESTDKKYVAFCQGVGTVWFQLVLSDCQEHRGTSRIRNSAPLGPYSRTLHRALKWPLGGGLFLMSEVPLYRCVIFKKNPGMDCVTCRD